MQHHLKRTVLCGACVVGVACSIGEGDRGDFGGADGGDAADQATAGGTSAADGDGGSGSGTASGPDDGAADDGTAQQAVDEARELFPTYMALHEGVITRTCTPFSNVCHNNKEYPELDTPLSVLAYFDKGCNLPERTSEPQSLYNGCEPEPDRVVFTSGPNVAWAGTEVAWIAAFYDDNGPTSFEVHLRDPIPQAPAVAGVPETVRFTRRLDNGTDLTVDDVGDVVYGVGATYFTVTNGAGLPQSNLDSLEGGILGGDLNRDGVFGAQDAAVAMRELNPGNPWQSYLLQRVQGNVPGSPMPLANQPLSAPEILAIACWIEGAGVPAGQAVDAVIDYDGCQYAAEFGTPPDDSGATLSADVQPIFDSACAFAGCHASTNPAEGLDLSPGSARDALLSVPSAQLPMVNLVELGNPTNSYLVKKLRGADDTAGAAMPPEGYERLSEQQLATVKLWISYGAPND